MNEGGDELIEKTVLLSEESVSITYGTTQDTTDDVTGLGIRRQLTVSNGERYSTQMVGADAHSDIDIVLFLADRSLCLFLEGEVFQTSDVLLGLDDRLEDISVVIGMLALHHAN